MNYVFISVNFNSSYLIDNWIKSINNCSTNSHIIIVDNFSTTEEREIIRSFSKKYSFKLLELDNVGYSKAMNQALLFCKKTFKKGVIFCGNLDITFLNIPRKIINGSYVYVPKVTESERNNRNPFLTVLQKKIIPIYKSAAKKKSIYIYFLAVILNKILGFFPSKVWAIHGSLFCFNFSLIRDLNDLPFNNNSFLYSEEWEFASFIENNNFSFLKSDIHVKHFSNATTSILIKNQKDFIKIWAPSFINYTNRWNL